MRQAPLTSDLPEPARLDLPDAEVYFYESFFAPAESDVLFAELLATTAWRQEQVRLFGRAMRQPRLTAWYGDAGAVYSYSGLTLTPLPWTPALRRVKDAVEAAAGTAFNGVLANRYRDGRDSMGWHADDEPELGPRPVVASVSFGATRRFDLRHRGQPALRASIDLTHGSLLLMRGETQHHWQHAVPKTARPLGERVNLTFRTIV